MSLPIVTRPVQMDPILVAFSLHYPINPDVLERAIVYREALIDDIREEIAILQHTIARLHPGQEAPA